MVDLKDRHKLLRRIRSCHWIKVQPRLCGRLVRLETANQPRTTEVEEEFAADHAGILFREYELVVGYRTKRNRWAHMAFPELGPDRPTTCAVDPKPLFNMPNDG